METDYKNDLDALERACEEVLDAETLKAVVAAKRRIATDGNLSPAGNMAAMRDKVAVAESATTTGNMAAMYEALVRVKRLFDGRLMWQPDIHKAHEAVNAALTAPPRNCDLFNGDHKMLHTAWFDWTGSPQGHDADGTVRLTFDRWLLEIAGVRHA